jgi:hypothetical protein
MPAKRAMFCAFWASSVDEQIERAEKLSGAGSGRSTRFPTVVSSRPRRRGKELMRSGNLSDAAPLAETAPGSHRGRDGLSIVARR